jgi:hypothetical protein
MMIILAMKRPEKIVSIKGRFLGIAVLVVIQCINGIIHTFSGVALLLGSYIPMASSSNAPLILSFYTLTYGILTIVFTYLLWKGKRLGWIGTVTVLSFVIIADILTIFDLITFLGVVKTAGIGEIPYCLVILLYLIQNHVRSKYSI